MTNAQNHIDTNFDVNKATQINIIVSAPVDKLTGELVIKDYPLLENIDLSVNELESLTIINCPKLRELDIYDNKITKLDITKIKTTDDTDGGGPAPAISFKKITLGKNLDLKEFSVEYCPNLDTLRASENPKLNRIVGMDKLEKVGTTVVKPGMFRQAFLEKINYWRDLAKTLREILGLGENDPLPQKAITGPDGTTQQVIDKDKLKNNLETKVISSSQLQNDKATVERERDEVKAKLEAQKDYGEIKTERDQLKQNFQAIAKKLGLTEQSTQAQLLTKIEALMAKPDSDNSDKISDLEGKLSGKDQQISELKSEKNKMISKRNISENLENGHFSLSTAQQSEIVNASAGKEAWEIREQAVKEKFGELKQARKNAIHLNVFLGSLTTLSLLLVAYLVIWKINPAAKDKEEIPGQSEKKQIKQKSKPSQ